MTNIRQPIVTVCGHVDHGKCISGETIIPLVDGTIKTAKQLFEENFDENKAEKIEDGLLQDISEKNIRIFSFDGREIVAKEISHIWKRESEELIEVKLQSGDKIKTTSEHPFFVFSLNGPEQKRAGEIKESDFVAIPGKIRIESSDLRQEIIEKLKGVDNFVCFVNENFDRVFSKLIKRNKDEIGRKLGIKNLSDSIRQRRFRIKDLFKLGAHLRIPDLNIYSVIRNIKNANEGWRAGHTSKQMALPDLRELEKLGYILGCIAGDGHIAKTNTILNNNDKDVQDAYINYLSEVFSLDSKLSKGHTCWIVKDICGTTFARFLIDIIGFPKKNKSADVEVPRIAQKNMEVFRGFFAGWFDTDGYVSKANNCIEITSKSKNLVKQCSALLLNFGINSNIYIKNAFHVLKIANKTNLNKFLENFRPRLKRKLQKVIESSIKAESSRIFDFLPLDGSVLKQLKTIGKINRKVPYFNKYVKQKQLSIPFIRKVLENIKQENEISAKLANIIDSEIVYAKVISRKIVKNEEHYVYDFTVPETNNFIAERFLVHNTSILDCFRGSCVQEGEAGGITQKISFTKYPIEQMKKVCPLIEKEKVKLDIPGFLFIDTPGHAAFTNLRKRGGSLADLAIVVVDIKKGIEPQTIEVFQILKKYKTPFLIALNKLDTISGWQKRGNVKESIESQAINVRQEFDEALLTFQGALQSHGFDSALYWEISDFTKQVALVPCSARSKEGISELLFVLCGLSQKFLKERLKLKETAKGVILEVKKEKGIEHIEAILYDGLLEAGDEVIIGSFDKPVVSKVRALEEIEPLCFKYKSAKKVQAANGIRLHLANNEGILSGMPFQKIENNLSELEKEFKKELSSEIRFDKEGIIAKADSLGSLEALLVLLRQEGIKIVKAGIGNVSKSDVVSAKAILENNPLDAVVVGFNVSLAEDVELGNVKFIGGEVVYKIIDELKEWRKNKLEEIERERMLGLATICKLEILPQYVFRNSNPAIFGVRVIAGKIKTGIPLIDDKGESVARVKSLQLDKESVSEANEGQELAIGLPGINFERRLKNDVKYLYADMGAKQFKAFKENKDLLSANELRVLDELARIKQF